MEFRDEGNWSNILGDPRTVSWVGKDGGERFQAVSPVLETFAAVFPDLADRPWLSEDAGSATSAYSRALSYMALNLVPRGCNPFGM